MAALDRCGIPYAVGGSVASSYHGSPRATNDVDLLVGFLPAKAESFAQALGPDFYADPDMIRDALFNGRSFNVIQLKTTYKFDFYPAASDPFAGQQLARRVVARSDLLGEPLDFPITTPEDIILAKLAWFRKGGSVSARQWNDVLGVVRIQGDRLDRAYLNDWAERLGVRELLDDALRQGSTSLSASPRRPETP
jgi:hypothetical protein